MNEEFVDFNLAKKLKEKGFACKYPFAMYDEDGYFYPLFTSCDEDKGVKSIFGNRLYYGYEDFVDDEDAIIAPTVSQVLKWLREEKDIVVSMYPHYGKGVNTYWRWDVGVFIYKVSISTQIKQNDFDSYEQAALAGIEYVLNDLI